MKISETIKVLEEHKTQLGDVEVVIWLDDQSKYMNIEEDDFSVSGKDDPDNKTGKDQLFISTVF